MNAEVAAVLLAMVVTSTEAAPVGVTLFRDYSACTLGRQVCAAERASLRLELAECEEASAPAPTGFGVLEVVGIGAVVAVVAGAVGLVVGVSK